MSSYMVDGAEGGCDPVKNVFHFFGCSELVCILFPF